MNVLFITLGDIQDIDSRGIYADLLREFHKHGHRVYVVSPAERRTGLRTQVIQRENCRILKVKTGNIQKTNILEKGIATVLLESQFISAIKKNLKDVKFDLVIYSTPPITLAGAVEYIRKRDGARTYLLLKDIFPQNAVDIGLMPKEGVKGCLYKFFRRKEKKLYALSDRIGCMSPANVRFLLKDNPEVEPETVEVCPNSVEPVDMTISREERIAMREKYGIPTEKTVFVYGGNLGRPQGVPYLMECLTACREKENAFFFIAGAGTEYHKLESFLQEEKIGNAKLVPGLPKEDYDRLVAACDVGLVFLDHRFLIPNFPSRLLSYMQAKLPVLCATDPNSDMGPLAEEGGYGWWCESNDAAAFAALVDQACRADLAAMGEKAWAGLNENYTVEKSYATIMKGIGASNG